MRRMIPLFLMLFPLGTGLVACGGGGGPGMGGGTKQAPDPVTVVEVARAELGSVGDLLVTNAAVESEKQADIIPQAAGIVRDIRVDLGQAVKKGDVLAVLENVSLSEGASRARSELQKLQDDLAATRRLYDEGAVSMNDVTTLEHQVRNARSSLREASAGSGQTRLNAPFDGVVAAIDVRVGQLASNGTRAFQVVDLTELRVRATLPERDFARVRAEQAARLVSAYDSDLAATAHVERVAPVIDPKTGTFEVLLALDPGQSLRPGQYVGVELEVDRHEDVIVVPKKAVVYEDGKAVVYRMIDAPEPEEPPEDDAPAADENAGGMSFSFGGAPGDAAKDEEKEKAPPSPYVAERVPVEVGLVDDRFAELEEGAAVGDDIIVVGQSALKDGAPVKTPEMVQADAEKAKQEAEEQEALAPEGDGEAG